jgi:hypothetical protein
MRYNEFTVHFRGRAYMVDYFDTERYQQDFYRNQAMTWRADINNRLSALVLPNGVGGSTPVGSTTPFLPYEYDFQDSGTVSSWLTDRIGRDLLSVATGYDALQSSKDIPENNKAEEPEGEKPSVLETILTNIVKALRASLKKKRKFRALRMVIPNTKKIRRWKL